MPLLRPSFVAALTAACALAAAPSALAGEILVRFEPGTSRAEQARLLASAGVEPEGRIPRLGIAVVDVPDGRVGAALAALRAGHSVVRAERNGEVRADAVPQRTRIVANDPLLGGESWQLTRPRFPEAWRWTTGSSAIVVAVLDTGVAADHEDLPALVPGYDFVNGDADAADDNGHGTAVAGIVAARGNNGRGVTGVCWQCRIMPVKVLDAHNVGTWDAVASGIVWATDNGAHVINLSLSAPDAPQAVADAVAYALARGRVVVASAGNGNDGTAVYPAAFPGVLSVGAVDHDDLRYSPANGNRAWGSNHGSWVRVAAAGCTNSTWHRPDRPRTAYVSGFCGTSAAAPQVSGLAALLLPYAAGGAAEVADAIERTAHPHAEFGGGRIDAAAALARVVARSLVARAKSALREAR